MLIGIVALCIHDPTPFLHPKLQPKKRVHRKTGKLHDMKEQKEISILLRTSDA